MSGLNILNVDGKLVVDSFHPDSPAAAADVQRGDVIMFVNGRPADTLRITDVQRLFRSKDGQRINLTVSRSGQELPIELQLAFGFWDKRHLPEEPADK
jgi:carboxyl-terminal processing protease